jgi:hypothetical protein
VLGVGGVGGAGGHPFISLCISSLHYSCSAGRFRPILQRGRYIHNRTSAILETEGGGAKGKAPMHAGAILASVVAAAAAGIIISEDTDVFAAMHTTSCQAGKSLLKTLQASPESAEKLQGPREAQLDLWVSAGGVEQQLAAAGVYQSKYYFGYSVVDEFGNPNPNPNPEPQPQP